MHIEAFIDYDGPEVATFDPQKVLERLCRAFPSITINHRDLAQDEVDSLIKHLDTQQIAETTRDSMLRQIREKAARNGPIYEFQLDAPSLGTFNGQVKRYRVVFQFEQKPDIATELIIIQFLQSLHLGILMSDTKTHNFCIPHPTYSEHWILAEGLLP